MSISFLPHFTCVRLQCFWCAVSRPAHVSLPFLVSHVRISRLIGSEDKVLPHSVIACDPKSLIPLLPPRPLSRSRHRGSLPQKLLAHVRQEFRMLFDFTMLSNPLLRRVLHVELHHHLPRRTTLPRTFVQDSYGSRPWIEDLSRIPLIDSRDDGVDDRIAEFIVQDFLAENIHLAEKFILGINVGPVDFGGACLVWTLFWSCIASQGKRRRLRDHLLQGRYRL